MAPECAKLAVRFPSLTLIRLLKGSFVLVAGNAVDMSGMYSS